MNSRITSYQPEYIEKLRSEFLDKFRKDKSKLVIKLDSISIPKGTYSQILNNEPIAKRTLEKMRAYLENRPPLFLTVKEGEFYCGGCENIFPLIEKGDTWSCKACREDTAHRVRKKNPGKVYARKTKWRAKFELAPGEFREKYLKRRKQKYLKKNYGKLARCVELIEEIKKGLK